LAPRGRPFENETARLQGSFSEMPGNIAWRAACTGRGQITVEATAMLSFMKRAALAGAAIVAIAGCRETALTRGEAAAALEEAGISAQAQSLTSSSVEITTNFTIGMAVESAAMELRTFIATQLPCAEVTLSGSTLTIVYGARPGTCTYCGQTYAGTHTVTIMRNQMDDVVVGHTWTALHNDKVEVTGTAMVTWSFANRTRHVVHELTWTRLSDGRQGVGSGDRLQSALPDGTLVGFSEDGTRTWEGESGTRRRSGHRGFGWS